MAVQIASLGHQHRQAEAMEVIENMAGLDDLKTMQDENFDSKLLIANSVLNSVVGEHLIGQYQDSELQQPDLVLSYERFMNFEKRINGYRTRQHHHLIEGNGQL